MSHSLRQKGVNCVLEKKIGKPVKAAHPAVALVASLARNTFVMSVLAYNTIIV